MIEIRDLLVNIPQIGKLEWIGIRSERHGKIITPESAKLIKGFGIEGDHRIKPGLKPDGKRQVTLIQAEHLPVIASIMKQKNIDPKLLRRNLVISGINVLSLKKQQFFIGSILFEGTDECHPCSRMEENLGNGGYNAMRGHGGINARILTDGIIKIGDIVKHHKI